MCEVVKATGASGHAAAPIRAAADVPGESAGRPDEGRELAALQSAPLDGAAVPARILLTPWGSVESTNGSFIVDEESAELAIRAFEEHGTDLPIDYEHQTLGGSYASPNGQAPAAGWVKRISSEPGVGLWAEIEWTQQASAMLGSKQYRYLSPVAIMRKNDRKLVAIHSAALTNKPAIVGMQPIVNRIGGDVAFGDESALDRLRLALELAPESCPEEVLVAASRRLEDLGREAQERIVASRIREAMESGKLVEAQRAWAEALVAREEGLFEEWMRTAPVVVRLGRTVPPRQVGESGSATCASAASARAEFRAHPALAGITTEEAYVADAVRRMVG